MIKKTLYLFLALGLPLWAQAQVNRCTTFEGKIVYSDIPCPSTSKDVKVIDKNRSASVELSMPRPEKVIFSGVPQTDYIKASAMMDNIRVIGRDCEWSLKVDRSKRSTCLAFMSKLQPGGEYSQISDQVTFLNSDRATAEQNIEELRTLTSHMKEIVRYKEFMLANLGVNSR